MAKRQEFDTERHKQQFIVEAPPEAPMPPLHAKPRGAHFKPNSAMIACVASYYGSENADFNKAMESIRSLNTIISENEMLGYLHLGDAGHLQNVLAAAENKQEWEKEGVDAEYIERAVRASFGLPNRVGNAVVLGTIDRPVGAGLKK